MSYIGNTPAENYASFLTETFTVSATANYTLSHAVTNENDIRLVINGVVQQPGSGKAYTASGTTLTLTSATVSGDVMYAVYLGRALQTVNPPNASVGTSQLASDAVTLSKMASGTDGNIISYDASGNPVAVATGTAGQILTSAGAGAPPTFATAAASNPYTALSAAADGYITLVGGLIIQWGFWGTFGGTVSTGSVTFPITFPNNKFTVVTGLYNGNSTGLSSLVLNSTVTTSGFTWYQDDTAQSGRLGGYIAIGN